MVSIKHFKWGQVVELLLLCEIKPGYKVSG